LRLAMFKAYGRRLAGVGNLREVAAWWRLALRLSWIAGSLAAAPRNLDRTLPELEALLQTYKHPEHGYRSCLGLLSLSRRYGNARLEAACERALALGTFRYRHVRDLLANNLDLVTQDAAPDWTSPAHANVRGPGYYQ